MILRVLLVSTAIIISAPAFAEAPATQAVAESAQPHSSVSVLVEPALNDGRLVVKIAAKNRTSAPVPFGPASISISKPNGEAIALYSLPQLVDDVRLAAGMTSEANVVAAPTQGAYASPVATMRDGKMDVSGFTGGSTVGGDEYIRRNQRRPGKPTISKAEAEAQIAALKRVFLQDRSVAPGELVVGQVVSQKLKFGKDEDRTVHLRVRFAGDEHTFTLLAPAK